MSVKPDSHYRRKGTEASGPALVSRTVDIRFLTDTLIAVSKTDSKQSMEQHEPSNRRAKKASDSVTSVRAREDLRQILDAAAMGLTRCSRDLRYLSCNPAYEKLAGLPAQQIIGRP